MSDKTIYRGFFVICSLMSILWACIFLPLREVTDFDASITLGAGSTVKALETSLDLEISSDVFFLLITSDKEVISNKQAPIHVRLEPREEITFTEGKDALVIARPGNNEGFVALKYSLPNHTKGVFLALFLVIGAFVWMKIVNESS
jgi:hypothetical protein